MFLSVFLIVTVAPATTAPCGSLTIPTMLPVISCAAAGIAPTASPRSARKLIAFLILNDIRLPPSFCIYSDQLTLGEDATDESSLRRPCFFFVSSFSVEKILLPDASELCQPILPGRGYLGSGLCFLESRKRSAIDQQANVIVNLPSA